MNLGDEEARDRLLAELMSDALRGPSNQIAHLDPKRLSARELPPGTWSQLYVLYQASCLAEERPCASRAVFYACTKTWRKALKFRPFSKHSICKQCDQLKSEMRHSNSFLQHATSADKLLGHLSLTWRCRQAYWHAREVSQSHQDLLCIIFDGFDKSKPAFPRWPHHRQPKGATFERISRTHVAVSALLCHGYGCFVFLCEEGGSTGGSYSWECILHAVDVCQQEDRRCGRASPRNLWIQHDNTVKELKHSLSGAMMAYLVSGGFYDECGAHMLPVGHTHEDIGSLAVNLKMASSDSESALSSHLLHSFFPALRCCFWIYFQPLACRW